MDMRLEKDFRTTGNLGLTFSIDAFNIFNNGVVLDRFRNTTSGNVGGSVPPGTSGLPPRCPLELAVSV